MGNQSPLKGQSQLHTLHGRTFVYIVPLNCICVVLLVCQNKRCINFEAFAGLWVRKVLSNNTARTDGYSVNIIVSNLLHKLSKATRLLVQNKANFALKPMIKHFNRFAQFNLSQICPVLPSVNEDQLPLVISAMVIQLF